MKNRLLRFLNLLFLSFAAGNFVSAAEAPLPDYREELKKTAPWLDEIKVRKDNLWRPKYDGAEKETKASRTKIVSYAGKWTRHNYGGHDGLVGSCGWRYASSTFTPRKRPDEIAQFIFDTYDVDGDGDKKDDFVFSLVHSMDVPLSIPKWPAASMFPEILNGVFYGGMTIYTANNDASKITNYLYEMGVNPDHSSTFYDTRAEDHPINGARHSKNPGSFLKHYVTMLWKKEDFLNGGDKARVSFDDSSRLAFLCTRGYWYGWNDIRYVVQNGEVFYISEILPEIPDYAFKDATRLKKKSGYLPIGYPTKLTWAVYKPEGHKVDFDPTKAEFKKVNFDDVRVVGWYLSKTDNSNAQTHSKWYGFDCDAVVHRPASVPSPNISMKEVKEGKLPPFYMSLTEVPYKLWQEVIYKWGDSPHYVLEGRYVYDKSGSMGSMAYGKCEHSHDEPLTDITFYDALALCNTLSEYEGKTPVYYTDPEMKTVFRNQHLWTRANYNGKGIVESRNFVNPTIHTVPIPKIFAKWSADGHRLPTSAEWSAAGGKAEGERRKAEGTAPVGTSKPNAKGFYDLGGNVSEFVWSFGDVYDPAQDPEVLALGGNFLPEGQTVSPYGDRPWQGSGAIGVRLVCRNAGLPAPDSSADAGNATVLKAKKETVIGKKEAPKVSQALIPMVNLPAGSFVRGSDKKTVKIAAMHYAKTNTTYDQWKTVKQWGEANGYDFNHSGDMGSMAWFDFTHHPDEPVTHIQWFDMITWCNALSEMEGRTPVFYEDEECAKVIRKAFHFKPIKLDAWDLIAVDLPPEFKDFPYSLSDARGSSPFIFSRWDADGYRLATDAEFEYATRGDAKTKFPWGDDEKQKDEFVWHLENSSGRTHKVAQKKPNGFGLHDMQGLVFEVPFSSSMNKDKDRPYALDLDNPINSQFSIYKKDKSVNQHLAYRGLLGGPSFLHGSVVINGRGGIYSENNPEIHATHYYPDVSFRVVRCEAGTHPRDGLRPLAEEEIIQHLKIEKNNWFEFGK